MQDVAVIEDPAAAEVSLDPIRARLLAELSAEPSSATMLAAKVGLPRQKVNYHLKTLEAHGLVEMVEERRKGNVNERIMRATAASYVISPAALASVQPDPARSPTSSRRAGCWPSRPAWSARSAPSSPAPPARASAWRPSRSTARCASPRPPTGPRSPRSSRGPSRPWCRSTTTSPPSRAATTGSSSPSTRA
ncbi:ArsR/SmtB family transcription factor [Thermocatellispora tengchongensis]|uniref:ArsR/SmtB family transcription factor n=1 Tax=Thermocatellispora tengchongensis TaxID=1073253 RepID=UPI0036341C2E